MSCNLFEFLKVGVSQHGLLDSKDVDFEVQCAGRGRQSASHLSTRGEFCIETPLSWISGGDLKDAQAPLPPPYPGVPSLAGGEDISLRSCEAPELVPAQGSALLPVLSRGVSSGRLWGCAGAKGVALCCWVTIATARQSVMIIYGEEGGTWC